MGSNSPSTISFPRVSQILANYGINSYFEVSMRLISSKESIFNSIYLRYGHKLFPNKSKILGMSLKLSLKIIP